MTCMRNLLIAILLLISFCAAGQSGRRLDKLGDNDAIPAGQAAFYGDFIQRLKKFKSGGYPQDIRIINIETNEVFIFRVKSTFKTSKENPFCYLIEPGTYAILNYWWTESKWYGGKSYMEPIYKGEDSILETERKIKNKEQRPDELVLFKFTVAPNTLNYAGTWHFEQSPVYFTDDKEQADDRMKDKYKKLDFSSSHMAIPD